MEGKAEPFGGSVGSIYVCRHRTNIPSDKNVTKALSVLMVDFSCAMKLAMPISVLSAIREASKYHLTVKAEST